MRKEKVIPNGIPASTKPIKSGPEEQEQNGVTAPKVTAKIRASALERPCHEVNNNN